MHTEGWDKCNDEFLLPYFNVRDELAINDGVLFYKNRLIIPSKLQATYVKLLHGEAHLGISKVIERAKLICYWPKFVSDIENYVKSCAVCNKFQRKNVKEPLLPHQIPEIPFHKLGADIAQLQDKNYLILTDYFSKWLEIREIKNKKAGDVVRELKNIFRTHGIPAQLVADNQPFNSLEFKTFAKSYNFTTVTSSPHYPQSNGMAESAVKRAKSLLKKTLETKGDIDLAVLEYNSTPIVHLGASPSQMLMPK
nr:PREDICTED: uncharacterized protein K02A2.6-like [Bemisia tabaci]